MAGCTCGCGVDLRIAGGALLVTALVSVLLIGGCPKNDSAGSSSSATAAKSITPAAAPSETYTVRGEVLELPQKGKPQREFKVHHEAIDTFVGSDGKVVGMNAMTMAFPPGDGVSISDLALGDKIELTFSVWRTDKSLDWFATKIVKLPADTALIFGKAKKPQ